MYRILNQDFETFQAAIAYLETNHEIFFEDQKEDGTPQLPDDLTEEEKQEACRLVTEYLQAI